MKCELAHHRESSKGRRRGITLLEIMLVLALLVAVAAMALPSLSGPLENHRLREAGDVVRTAWCRARVRAMDSGRTYVFRHQQSGNTYVIEPWSANDDYLESSDMTLAGASPVAPAPGAGAAASAPAAIKEKQELPESVSFLASEAATDARGALLAQEQTGSTLTNMASMTDTANMASATNTAGEDQWSSPIFFYPDGTTSTARLLLGNGRRRYVVLAMRGLTGIVSVSGLLTEEELP